jgi:hypothetical protein
LEQIDRRVHRARPALNPGARGTITHRLPGLTELLRVSRRQGREANPSIPRKRSVRPVDLTFLVELVAERKPEPRSQASCLGRRCGRLLSRLGTATWQTVAALTFGV